jgi:hypothetical protein
VAKVIKKIPKSCSDNVINSAVVRYDAQHPSASGQNCFNQCSVADRANASSICYVRCFYATVLGPQANHSLNLTGGMPIADLEDAWKTPFASEDASKGGCPSV